MKYRQERFGRNVDEVNILKLGDTHTGHPAYQEHIVDSVLEEISNRSNGRIFLMGDLLELSLTYTYGSNYDQTLTPEQQIDYWVEKLRPHKDIIIGAVSGNHNQRAVKEVGMNPMRLVFKILQCKEKYLGYSALIKYAFNKGCIHDYNWHGKTGARTNAGIMRKIRKMNKNAEADIYSMAHTHRLLSRDTDIRTFPDSRNMKTYDKRYYLLNTGSSLGWQNSYAELAGLNKVLLGYPIIRMSGERGNQKIEIDKLTFEEEYE